MNKKLSPFAAGLLSIVVGACSPTLHDPEESAVDAVDPATREVQTRVHSDFAPQPPPAIWLENCINPEALPLNIYCDFYGQGGYETITGEVTQVTVNGGSCAATALNLYTGSGKGPYTMILRDIKRQSGTTDFETNASLVDEPGSIYFRKCAVARQL